MEKIKPNQMKLLENVVNELYGVLGECMHDENFNLYMAKLGIFTESIDDIIYKLCDVIGEE